MNVVVVSLFDGLSGGRIAFSRIKSIKVKRYYSSEIDKYAIQIADKNNPQDTKHRLGDVTGIDGKALRKKIRKKYGKKIKIILIGGSPCQGFSLAGSLKGSSTSCGIDVTSLKQYMKLKRKEFEFNGQSYLFWEYVRIMKELKPDTFFLENVRVTKKWLPMFNKAMGVEPIMINSALVSAQNRVRFYWTNIEGVEQPEDKGILLKDVLENGEVAGRPCTLKEFDENSVCHHVANADDIKGHGYNKRIYDEGGRSPTLAGATGGNLEPKVLCKDTVKRVGSINKGSQGDRIYSQDGKAITLSAQSGGTAGNGNMLVGNQAIYRKLTPLECERLQTLDDDYTEGVSNSQRYKMIGNGWTIDVIVHILKGLTK